MLIGVVGYGVVGKNTAEIFLNSNQEVVVYDKYKEMYNSADHLARINECDLVFLAVPTPSLTDGACDLTAIHESVDWIRRPLCIRSTIPPGTTARLMRDSKHPIIFCPEYIGETPFHRFSDTRPPDVVVLGGDKDHCEPFLQLFRTALGPDPIYFVTDSITAELAKYMENCFLATKVAFVAQFYILAKEFGADFTQMREIWASDPRVGRSHSTVVDRLGFGGKCLPKDLAAIIAQARSFSIDVALLESVKTFNDELRKSPSGP